MANVGHYARAYGWLAPKAVVYYAELLAGLIVGAASVLRMIRRQRASVMAYRSAAAVYFFNAIFEGSSRGDFVPLFVISAIVCLFLGALVNVPDDPYEKFAARRDAESRVTGATPAFVVSGVFLAFFLALAVLQWTPWALDSRDRWPWFLLFAIDTILFAGALLSWRKKWNRMGIRFLIAGGVLTVPVGILPLILAILLRKKLTKAVEQLGDSSDLKREDDEFTRVELQASRLIDEGKTEDALHLYEELILRYPTNQRCVTVNYAISALKARLDQEKGALAGKC